MEDIVIPSINICFAWTRRRRLAYAFRSISSYRLQTPFQLTHKNLCSILILHSIGVPVAHTP